MNTHSAKSCDDVDVRNVLLDFLSIANDLLDLEEIDVFRPTALGVVYASRVKIHGHRVHLGKIRLHHIRPKQCTQLISPSFYIVITTKLYWLYVFVFL